VAQRQRRNSANLSATSRSRKPTLPRTDAVAATTIVSARRSCFATCASPVARYAPASVRQTCFSHLLPSRSTFLMIV
jgi:hypothetical protein